MDTSNKSISERNGAFYHNSHQQPNYLSGKVIDGLNGKLFGRENDVYGSTDNEDHENDLNANESINNN